MAKTQRKAGLLASISRLLGGLGFSLNRKQVSQVGDKMAQELARAPRIAIIGETGVGKSSTLNSLFKAGAPIDDIRPCTSETSEYAAVTEMNGTHGPIRVFDLPGLGQD